jgi:antagonist of KipI
VSVVVLSPGWLTTLQDRGRGGYAALGVGRAGPMDEVALRLANALVGNADDAAALEITISGPCLRFDAAATIALTGAEVPMRAGDVTLPSWRAVRVAAGTRLDIGHARRGARACLAIAGGFAAGRTLGSAATDVNARLGPFDGRPLAAGQALPVAAGAPRRAVSGSDATRAARPPTRTAERATPAWSLDPRPWFDADPGRPIRLIRGAHFDTLDAASRAAVFGEAFRIGADSNRVGFRLEGARLALAAPLELVSEAVTFGTLQLPPSGGPIALMAEHPTTGGYPQIGQVAAVDLPRLAQRRPGESLRFAEIGLDEAQTRYLERERELARLLERIAARLDDHD